MVRRVWRVAIVQIALQVELVLQSGRAGFLRISMLKTLRLLASDGKQISNADTLRTALLLTPLQDQKTSPASRNCRASNGQALLTFRRIRSPSRGWHLERRVFDKVAQGSRSP
jgi:hypothetical protein